MQISLQLRKWVSALWVLPLLFVSTGHVSAQENTLQEPISLSMSNARLDSVVHAVARQSKLAFSYDPARLAGIRVEKVRWQSVTLKKVLAELNTLTGLEYAVNNGTLALKIGRRTTAPASKAAGRFTGKIIDEDNSQPVAGASVRIGSKGAVTGEDGQFSIPLTKGSYTATISYVGYAYREIPGILIAEDSTTALGITLQKDRHQLGEVTVRADRLITTSNNKLVNEIRNATGVVSGISSEQITISADRSASEVARRVAGITLQDGFISIRGMTPRYNPVYLNNAFLPSTDPNKRAFNFDLLPSSVIDRIVVYKSAAPELPADFAGGVVKVYTKRSIPLRRFEISLNAQYRTGNKFFDNHTQAGSGKYDWLGYDDGTRAMPVNMPRGPHGQIILPDVINRALPPNSYTQSNEVITDALLARSTRSWNQQQVYHPADIQGDATWYTYVNIGKMKLNSVTVGRYENQRTYHRTGTARNINRYRDTVFPAPGKPLDTLMQYNYRTSTDSVYTASVRLAGMQHFSLIINPRHEISAMGVYNHTTKQTLQINTLDSWNIESKPSLFMRRFEHAYNMQDLFLGMLSGSHKINEDKHLIEWTGSYSKAIMRDPNQFSNAFDADPASIEGTTDQGFGRLHITDSTTWRYNTGTGRNLLVGRFSDGEGEEKRWQGNIDYTFKPFTKYKEFLLRTGAYVESRRKRYSYSALLFMDYPEFGFSAEPWKNLGDTLQSKIDKGARMHTGIQSVGLGGTETNGYQAIFDNLAGYLATNLPIRFRSPFGDHHPMKLDIYGGVRMEYSKRRVLTTEGEELLFEYTAGAGGQQVLVGSAPPTKQYFWLPSVAATLHLNDNWQLRMSYGKTLNRPELRELSPYVTYNPAEGFTYIGKPILHDARIDNYDLRLEWYPSAGETVSMGLYYKRLKEPIEETMASTNTGIPGFTHNNLPFARIFGAELEVRKRLDFIAGDIFRHMGVIINACYNYTEANNAAYFLVNSPVPDYYPGGESRPFMGAAPWIINSGLFYDHKASGSRFSLQYNIFGERILTNTAGAKVDELEPWMLERSRHLLDLSLLQKINKWVSVRVAAQNILNAPLRQYVDNDFNQQFNTAPTYLEWNLHRQDGTPFTKKMIQGDYYVKNYRPGIYYTLGFQITL